MTTCPTLYSAPRAPGSKVHHLWRCELPAGHDGPHRSPSQSISVTMAAHFTVAARIAGRKP